MAYNKIIIVLFCFNQYVEKTIFNGGHFELNFKCGTNVNCLTWSQ